MLTLLIIQNVINVVSATNLLMTSSEKNPLIELAALEAKLDALIVQFNLVKNENKLLKNKQDELIREKAKLLEKTTLAKSRVETMISRLKSLENDS